MGALFGSGPVVRHNFRWDMAASVGAGLLWDREGASATFTAAAGVAGVAGAMLWLLPARR